jgi:predicted MFS family arabinose efflux permease
MRPYGSRLVFATTIVFSGYGLGIFTLVPLSQLLVDAYDWRGAYLRLGLGILVLLIPLILLPWSLIRAGDPRLLRATAASNGSDSGPTLLTAVRGSAFWGLFCTLFFTSLGMFAILVEVVAYLRDVASTLSSPPPPGDSAARSCRSACWR